MSETPYAQLVRAVESGELRAMPRTSGAVYSTLLVLLGSGPRVLPAYLIAHCSGLSERKARPVIDELVRRKLVTRTPLRTDHRERFTARYELP